MRLDRMMGKRVVIEAAAIWLMAAMVMAQSGSPAASTTPAPKEAIANGGLIRTLEAAPVLGQPYSAVQVSRIVQTLADGSTIKKGPGPGHAVLRDSAGRVRIEKRVVKPHDGDPGISMYFVLDPVAHTLTTWSVGGKSEQVATLIKLPAEKPHEPTASMPQAVKSESGRPQPVVTTEDLGTEMLDGVSVDAVKTTTVIPAGRAGNDAPITRTHEVWTSPDMKLIMKEQWVDPRSGDLLVWLSNFSRAEPDPAMFRAPAGYKVKDLKETMQELAQKLGEMQE